MASIVPVLLYGVFSLENRHLKTIDAWFHRFLRRCIGAKASFYSRVTHGRVWKVSGKLPLPSQTLLSRHLQQLVGISPKPPADALHHVSSHQAMKTGLSLPNPSIVDTPAVTGTN